LPRKTYQVIENFDESVAYPVKIDPRFKNVLISLKKGELIEPANFIRQNIGKFCKGTSQKANMTVVYDSLQIGTKIGIIKEVQLEPISFEEFVKYETVQYCAKQINGCKYKHEETTHLTKGLGGTQRLYLYHLWHLNNWLIGKKITIKKMHQVDIETFKEISHEITLEGLEHLLKLYQESHNSDKEIVKILKNYLMDDLHKGKRASTIDGLRSAILAYFEKNDTPIKFKFDPKTKYRVTTDDDDKPSLTLEDMFKMLTVGRPSIAEKAIILCKFHRGLDNSTFVDRFNFQAWEQLVEHFGTEDFERWDMQKCPVPIKLVRIKTNFMHAGFLDVDAIEALQDYLRYRKQKTGRDMMIEQPIFLNIYSEPIKDNWVRRLTLKLARRAGIQRKLEDYNLSTRYEKEAHEMRDLLKSTLIDCGARIDVADHVIGHKFKDSYEKQATLYPATIRAEFMKSSNKINIFSKFSHLLSGNEKEQSLREQVTELTKQLTVQSKGNNSQLEEMRENQERLMRIINKILKIVPIDESQLAL
jgi:hypothetical protein